VWKVPVVSLTVKGNQEPSTGRTGRPAGLLINPAAVRHLLGDTPQMSLLGAARVSAPVLSELLSGKRGASRATADRIAKALNCDTAVIFPELVEFQTTVRVFTARGADA
jgi:hypothetical protein